SAREFAERGGCYAEYVAAREDLLYALPEGVDLDQAAGLANYQVAWHLLNSALKGFQYDSALVVAAAGGVGSALVQLSKAAGKRVLAVVSSDERAAFVRDQGADQVIDRKQGSVVDQVKRLTGGRGVDLVLDPAGGPNMTSYFGCLDRFGMLVRYGGLEGAVTGNIDAAIASPPWRSTAYRYFSMHKIG